MPSVNPEYQNTLDAVKEHEEKVLAESGGKFEATHLLFGYEGSYPPLSPRNLLSSPIPGLKREDIEREYVEKVGGVLTNVDIASLHTQNDLIASAEKAFRAMHTTRTEAFLRGLSRQNGHVHANGLLESLESAPLIGG